MNVLKVAFICLGACQSLLITKLVSPEYDIQIQY